MPADGWNGYWRATLETAAHKAGGPQEEVLARFWTALFKSTLPWYSHPRLLDVACGNGALARYVFATVQHLPGAEASLIGLDRSSTALVQMRKRFPMADGVVADACRTPFRDGAFDLVASQFGVEYAGIEAIGEAARLVAPRGVFAAIMHLKDGGIFQECAINLKAVKCVCDSGFLARAKQLFVAGAGTDAMRRGTSAFRQAGREFAPAAEEVAAALRNLGNTVAGGVVYQLHADVAYMVDRIGAYDPRAAIAWIDQMSGEVETYRDRMSSMLEAAVGESEMDQILLHVAGRGLIVRVRDTMRMGSKGDPAAWVLVFDRH